MNLFLAVDAAPAGGNTSQMFLSLLPWLLFIFFFYYLFVAMPMKKKQKQFQELMSNIKSGDKVLTNSGMYGVVTKITEKTIGLRIANNVVVEMDKSAIAGLAPEEKEEKK